MRPEEVEDVIRRPAARVGVQVEPGLVAEIVRDVASAPAYLPLLQYVLSEVFERRTEDRLTVHAYRSLGGVQGVLERRAEATFSSLGTGAQRACRQLFLRMVNLGDHGEETRRRLPLTELQGLGRRPEVDEALGAFSASRLLTYDRDPVTRTPTVEVAHETVISRWTRYRIWIDETRADLLAHRRLSAAAATWAGADEDPSYLLMGGPLAAALDVASGERLVLNELEARFVSESRRADEAARQLDAERRRQEAVLAHRARTRLAGGIATAVIAVVIAVLAGFAWFQRQRANDLAAAQGSQNLARELAAASVANLTSADSDLSLLLALEAAGLSLDAGEEILPEVVDALHRAVINPRPGLIIEGAGSASRAQLLVYSQDGTALVALAADGGAIVIDPGSGDPLGRISIPKGVPSGFGIGLHPDGQRILTIHPDGVRQWDWPSGDLAGYIQGVDVSSAVYSPDGSLIAIGDDDGIIRLWSAVLGELVAELDGHSGRVSSIDFDPTGRRLVSGGSDTKALVWDIESRQVTAQPLAEIVVPVFQVAWHPFGDLVLVTTGTGEIFLFNATTGERLNSYGNGQVLSRGVAFDPYGRVFVAAGDDGFARIFGTGVGGEAAIILPTGGVPIRDAEFDASGSAVATVGVDGNVRVWRDILGSELFPVVRFNLYPQLVATPDGERYLFGGHNVQYNVSAEQRPTIEVFDATTGETLLRRDTFHDWNLERGPAISVDGSQVAFAGPSGNVEIVEVDSETTTVIAGSADWTLSLAFSSDGALIAGGGIDGSITIWEVSTGEVVRMLLGHGDRAPAHIDVSSELSERLGLYAVYTVFRVDQVVFRPGVTELASVGFDGTIRAWDLKTDQSRILHEFDYRGASVAYSPNGQFIAAADSTGTVVVLDAASGEIVARPERVSGRTELVFSPDGRFLAGAGPGPVAHLWEIETERVVRRFQGSIYQPTSVAFVNDGTELRVSSGEGILRGYVLDPLALVEIARSEVKSSLTEAECEQYLRRSCGG
jgi:WD40 repeat protein